MRLRKFLMHQRHRAHPIAGVKKKPPGIATIGETIRLQVQQTRDHLQIILHPMMSFLKQCFLLPQRCAHLLRRRAISVSIA